MGERKREDPATLGDLHDLADAIKGGFKEAFGSVIPAPKPKEGEGGEGSSSGESSSSGEGSGSGTPAPDNWGFGGRWWGGSKS